MKVEEYRSYMDNITPSDALRERLSALAAGAAEPRAKRPAYSLFARFTPRAAALAACAALLVGVGIYAVTRLSGALPLGTDTVSSAPANDPTSETTIDLAPEDDLPDDSATKTLGGYELQETRADVDVRCYYFLPWIDYGTESVDAAADWAPPEGVTMREMSAEELAAFLGGDSAVADHLDWSGYELTGHVWWNDDGTLWAASVYGYAGPLDHFEFMLCNGQLPPACIVFEGSVEQMIWNVPVTADKHDGEYGCSRRVSFMKDNFGYRFDLTGTNTEHAELLTSRLVRYILADDGMRTDILSPDGTIQQPAPDAAPVPNTPAPDASEAATSGAAASVPPQEG